MSEQIWLDAVTPTPPRLASRGARDGRRGARARPRKAGAKMVVSATGAWGSIGGGDLEAVAIERARAMLAEPGASPSCSPSSSRIELPTSTGRSAAEASSRCCSSRCRSCPRWRSSESGMSDWELARILARHDLELHLIDTRPEMLADQRLASSPDAVQPRPPRIPAAARDSDRRAAAGRHVLIMTHDHAEDLALCDVALGATT